MTFYDINTFDTTIILQDQPQLLKKMTEDEIWMSCDLNPGTHAHEWMPVWYLRCYC